MPNICQDLTNLKLAKFRFVFAVLERLHLPTYAGSTLRGGFGHAFKRITCCNPQKDCHQCLLKEKCIYCYVFEGFSQDGPKRYKTNTPHPFVIEPPAKSQYNEGEELEFHLLLIGKAIDYLPYFIYTFTELGKLGLGKNREKIELKCVESLKINSDDLNLIYDNQTNSLLSPHYLITISDILENANNYRDNKQLSLNFLTPTRIKYQDRLTAHLDFDLLRRQQ